MIIYYVSPETVGKWGWLDFCRLVRSQAYRTNYEALRRGSQRWVVKAIVKERMAK